jgi:aspartate-semialdehyde dehydrogenase
MQSTVESHSVRDRWGWTAAHRAQQVGVIGATGAVGRELLRLLHDSGHAHERIDCLARAASVLDIAPGVRMNVRAFDEKRDGAFDLAFLCTPSGVSLTLAKSLVERGVRVIDLSSAFRRHADVPLVIPEINGDLLAATTRLVANPNCTTAVAAMPLAAIDRAARLEEVVIVSFQAASGVGQSGLTTLDREMKAAASGAAPAPVASPFPATLALNVIPGVADIGSNGISGEEDKVMYELKRILRRDDLAVEVTTTRVPVERCHSVAVHAKLARAMPVREAIECLRSAPGVSVTADAHGPRPRECAGADDVFVGRIRAGTLSTRSLCFFAVGDQLRKGAALNALQVAAALPAGR